MDLYYNAILSSEESQTQLVTRPHVVKGYRTVCFVAVGAVAASDPETNMPFLCIRECIAKIRPYIGHINTAFTAPPPLVAQITPTYAVLFNIIEAPMLQTTPLRSEGQEKIRWIVIDT